MGKKPAFLLSAMPVFFFTAFDLANCLRVKKLFRRDKGTRNDSTRISASLSYFSSKEKNARPNGERDIY